MDNETKKKDNETRKKKDRQYLLRGPRVGLPCRIPRSQAREQEHSRGFPVKSNLIQ